MSGEENTSTEKSRMLRIKCPYCGYKMPVYFDPDKPPDETGIYMRCKRRSCKRIFELKV